MDGVTKECGGTTEVPYGFIFYDTEAAAILEMFTELEAINTKAVFLINTPYRLPGEIPKINKTFTTTLFPTQPCTPRKSFNLGPTA